MIRIGHDDVDRWVLQLDKAASKMPGEAAKVVNRGALQIKKGARERVTGFAHLPRYPYTITYDPYLSLRGPGAEIGPEHRGQGMLAAIIEYGSPTSAPIPHMLPAVEDELPKFEQAMRDLAVKALE